MNLGLTTQTFTNVLTSRQCCEEEILDFAAEIDLNWVELRDKGLHYSADRLHALKQYAESKNIRIHYAWDAGSILDDGALEEYTCGIRNAALFGDGTISRVTLDTTWIMKSEGIGYSRCIFEKMTDRIQAVQELADKMGTVLAFENAFEPVSCQDGFSFPEFFEVIPNMKMTFDSANFLNREQQKQLPKPEQVKEFYCRWKDRIPYLHLKSTVRNTMSPVLEENADFSFQEFLGDHTKWFCIELPAQPLVRQCMENLLASKEKIQNGQI